MRSYNRTILMGHLAADPELRETKSGKQLSTFSLATDRDWLDSSGEKHKKVDFHKIVAWQKLAEICAEYLAKGSAVMVEGRLSNRSYENKDGDKRFVTEIIANEVNIITWKKSDDGDRVSIENVGQDEHGGDEGEDDE